MFKRILLAALIFAVNISFQSVKYKGVDGRISEFKSQTKCENVSVVIYDRGELSYYGDSEGLYQIGSMTKSFTGLAVQKLISEGKLSADGTISERLPGFTVYYDSSNVDITVRNLLEQKSGFTNSEKDYPSATADMTLDEWAESISGKELKSMPGTEYSYSNVNYNLLGLIIEKVTGRTYSDYMEEEILMPLGLKDVSVGEPDGGRIIEGSRLGFRKSFDYHVPVRTASIPAGYFYSNTESIGLWLKAWIENADSDMDEVISNLNENGDYYAGWERFGDDVIGHSGGTPNYSSRIVFSRSKELGVCVLTNLNVAATTDSLCNSLFEELDGGAGSGLVCDVWTVFDIIFTSVSVIGIAFLIVTLFMKKKGILIGTGAFLAVLLVLVFVLFPLIFGAGIRDIAFVWAPWSFIAGIVILMADMAGIVIKLVLVKVNEGRTKTG